MQSLRCNPPEFAACPRQVIVDVCRGQTMLFSEVGVGKVLLPVEIVLFKECEGFLFAAHFAKRLEALDGSGKKAANPLFFKELFQRLWRRNLSRIDSLRAQFVFGHREIKSNMSDFA